MKSDPINLELSCDILPDPVPTVSNTRRFQVLVESSDGVCVLTSIADSTEEGVEAFMCQMPRCEEGKICLFDAREQRVVASVKWKLGATEIGFSVPHRQNVFHDWHLALIGLGVQRRRSVQASVELSS